MYQITVLLPLKDNRGRPFPKAKIAAVQERLAQKFGGYTAYRRAPAKGVWLKSGKRQTDDIVVVEVFAEKLERHWWRGFASDLERELQQEEIVVHSIRIEKLGRRSA